MKNAFSFRKLEHDDLFKTASKRRVGDRLRFKKVSHLDCDINERMELSD